MKKVFEPMFEERQNQIMKFYVSGNVHYVDMTSLIFAVIGRLHPKDQELSTKKMLPTDTSQSVS